jgi:hypothetical protein
MANCWLSAVNPDVVFVRISFHDNIRKFLQTLTSPPDRTGRADSCFFNCLFRVEKTTKLLGIKGYCTDVEETNTDNVTLINRYHDLYKIEQAFRV